MTAAAADRWLTTARRVVGVAFGVLTLAAFALWLGYRIALPGEATQDEALTEVIFVAAGAVFGFVGSVVLRGDVRQPVGWSFALIGLFGALDSVRWGLSSWTEGPYVDTAIPFLAPLLATGLLTYPTGRLPSPGWRWMVWVITGMAVLDGAALLGFGGFTAVTEIVGLSVSLVVLFSLVSRWRSAGPVERQQLKWLVAAFAVAGVVLISAIAYSAQGSRNEGEPGSWIGDLVFALALSGIPLVMGIAIRRYRLFDLDRLISRTLLYTLVVGLMACVYVLTVLALGRMFPAEGDLQVAVATLAAAAVSIPAGRRIRRWLDRRFFRSRYDANQVIADFAAQLQNEIDLGNIVGGAARAVDSTFQPEVAAVWLAEDAS